MRRVVIAVAATVAIVVAVLLYRSPSMPAPSVKQAGPSPTPTPSTSPTATDGVFTGPRVQAFQRKMGYVFGDVQVVVTLHGGQIVAITTPVAPPDGDTGGRGTRPITQSITQFALPLLTREAIRAQSANIQSVSGATYTAEAFISSLQAALLQAHR